MKVMLLTCDSEMALRFRIAAEHTERVLLCSVKSIPEALEKLFYEPFDALISDDPDISHPRIRKSPVLWPNQIYLLCRDAEPMLRVTEEVTYCFPRSEDPKRIFDLITSLPGGQTHPNDPERYISAFLQSCGFLVSLSGFDYLKEAIRLILMQNHATDVPAINDLYGILAKEMSVSASTVEHAMRHAIDTAWILADPAMLDRLFGETVQSERAAPSNAAFLFRAADQITIGQKRGRAMIAGVTAQKEEGLRTPCCDQDVLLNATINAVMRRLCVPAKLLGYRYIFLAVRFLRTRPPETRTAAKSGIYSFIENSMYTTKPMIMRTMHYAIEHAWKRADPDVLHSYLGTRGTIRKDPPSNMEFIYLIAERVRLICGDPSWEGYCIRLMPELGKQYPWLNGLTKRYPIC